jgi:hypothetical protein
MPLFVRQRGLIPALKELEAETFADVPRDVAMHEPMAMLEDLNIWRGLEMEDYLTKHQGYPSGKR